MPPIYTHPMPPPNPHPRVWSRQVTYNNDEAISGSGLKSMVKVAYYQAFALFYGFCGAFAGEWAVDSNEVNAWGLTKC